MSEAKFTPGPWEVSPNDPCRVNVAVNTFLHPYEPRVATADEQDDDDFHDDWNICQAGGDHYSRPHYECVANARLIAAAPALLAALIELYDATSTNSQDKILAARAVARRAMGQAEQPQQGDKG